MLLAVRILLDMALDASEALVEVAQSLNEQFSRLEKGILIHHQADLAHISRTEIQLAEVQFTSEVSFIPRLVNNGDLSHGQEIFALLGQATLTFFEIVDFAGDMFQSFAPFHFCDAKPEAVSHELNIIEHAHEVLD